MDPLNKWRRMAVKSNQCKSINSCGCIISQSRPLVNLKPIAKKSSSEQLFSSFRQQLIMQDGNIKAKCLKPLYWKKELKWHDAPLHIIQFQTGLKILVQDPVFLKIQFDRVED